MTKPRPGIINNPWLPPPPLPQTKPLAPREPPKSEDTTDAKRGTATIQISNYGGISSDTVSEPKEIAGQLLEFCVRNLPQIEDTLAEYGVVVAKVPDAELDLKFYVRRADKWTLAVPLAHTREDGLLQLVQALLAVQRIPAMKKKLEDAGLCAFRF